MKARNYMFTAFTKPNIDSKEVTYCVYQKEICPTTDKVHWQGYIELNKPTRLKATQKIIGDDTAHIELRRGNQEQAIKYCTKQKTRAEGAEPIEIGEPTKQGKRKDLKILTDMIDEGSTLREVAS